jgi:hypothetical protein
MSTRDYLVVVGVVVVALAAIVGWGVHQEDAKERRREEVLRSIDDTQREWNRQLYEERTRGPCGEAVEMINREGDARAFCARDVGAAEHGGWIRR